MASTTNDCEYSPATPNITGSTIDDENAETTVGENGTIDRNSHIPLEMQVEEVDMNDEDMDLLEWSVRKLIPIPKKYFWEEPVNTDLPLKTKVWHRTVGVMGSMVRLTDRIGKPIVDNATQSSGRFSYVTSTMTKEEWEESKQTVQERKNRQEELNSHREHFVKKVKQLNNNDEEINGDNV